MAKSAMSTIKVLLALLGASVVAGVIIAVGIRLVVDSGESPQAAASSGAGATKSQWASVPVEISTIDLAYAGQGATLRPFVAKESGQGKFLLRVGDRTLVRMHQPDTPSEYDPGLVISGRDYILALADQSAEKTDGAGAYSPAWMVPTRVFMTGPPDELGQTGTMAQTAETSCSIFENKVWCGPDGFDVTAGAFTYGKAPQGAQQVVLEGTQSGALQVAGGAQDSRSFELVASGTKVESDGAQLKVSRGKKEGWQLNLGVAPEVNGWHPIDKLGTPILDATNPSSAAGVKNFGTPSITSDGAVIVAATDKGLQAFDAKDGKALWTVTGTISSWAVDGEYLVTVDPGAIHLWRFEKAKESSKADEKLGHTVTGKEIPAEFAFKSQAELKNSSLPVIEDCQAFASSLGRVQFTDGEADGASLGPINPGFLEGQQIYLAQQFCQISSLNVPSGILMLDKDLNVIDLLTISTRAQDWRYFTPGEGAGYGNAIGVGDQIVASVYSIKTVADGPNNSVHGVYSMRGSAGAYQTLKVKDGDYKLVDTLVHTEDGDFRLPEVREVQKVLDAVQNEKAEEYRDLIAPETYEKLYDCLVCDSGPNVPPNTGITLYENLGKSKVVTCRVNSSGNDDSDFKISMQTEDGKYFSSEGLNPDYYPGQHPHRSVVCPLDSATFPINYYDSYPIDDYPVGAAWYLETDRAGNFTLIKDKHYGFQ